MLSQHQLVADAQMEFGGLLSEYRRQQAQQVEAAARLPRPATAPGPAPLRGPRGSTQTGRKPRCVALWDRSETIMKFEFSARVVRICPLTVLHFLSLPLQSLLTGSATAMRGASSAEQSAARSSSCASASTAATSAWPWTRWCSTSWSCRTRQRGRTSDRSRNALLRGASLIFHLSPRAGISIWRAAAACHRQQGGAAA